MANKVEGTQRMNMVYCRGCAKQIHETAPTCPQCGAPQTTARGKTTYSSYGEVPWYRKNWFAFVCFFFFFPGLWIMMLSGDIYYQQKGQLKTYPTSSKVILWILSISYVWYGLHKI